MTPDQKAEYENLKAACLKKDGEARKDAEEKDLARLKELALLADEEEQDDPEVVEEKVVDDESPAPVLDVDAKIARNMKQVAGSNNDPLSEQEKTRLGLLRARLARSNSPYPPKVRAKFFTEYQDLVRREKIPQKKG